MIYLCLDLTTGAAEMIDWTDIRTAGAAGVQFILASRNANSAGWVRTWRCFTERADALAHAADNPTLVVIPLDPQTVPLQEID